MRLPRATTIIPHASPAKATVGSPAKATVGSPAKATAASRGKQQQKSALLTHLGCFQNDKLIVRRNRRTITKRALQLTEVIEMAVADDVQLAAVFQAAAGIVKHLPGDMVGNGVLLMERRIHTGSP